VIFWVETNLGSFFIVCLYMYCRWRSSYQAGKVGTPLTGSTPPHYCACPKPGHGSPTSYVVGFLYSVKIRVHCSFCWYWWNQWPYHHCINFPFNNCVCWCNLIKKNKQTKINKTRIDLSIFFWKIKERF
jgi:hypothetical protein